MAWCLFSCAIRSKERALSIYLDWKNIFNVIILINLLMYVGTFFLKESKKDISFLEAKDILSRIPV